VVRPLPGTAAVAPGSSLAVERAHLVAGLDECGWRINGPGGAAEQLDLNPNTLRFRMKKLAIVRPTHGRPRA
jgi:formate hydrogenlyase transcriptional activator